MKKWIVVVVFVLRWTTQEAKENEKGYPGDAVFHLPGCHIETVNHEKRFDNFMDAAVEMASLETDGLKPKLFKVTEEPIKEKP